jgi:hypothetical protein
VRSLLKIKSKQKKKKMLIIATYTRLFSSNTEKTKSGDNGYVRRGVEQAARVVGLENREGAVRVDRACVHARSGGD